MVDLVEEGFDLAIRTFANPDSSLIVRRIATYRLLVCGSPEYLAKRGMPQQPADLADHNCLVYSYAPNGSEWTFAGRDEPQIVAVTGNMFSNSANALRLAAVHGQGLVILPSFLLVDEIKSGALIPVLADFLQTQHPINAIYPHRHHLSAKVRSFLDLLVEHFRANPFWADPCKALSIPHAATAPANVHQLSGRPVLRSIAATAAQPSRKAANLGPTTRDTRLTARGG
jgi:DNA-binding transcriptional LysR family regulator